MKDPNATIVSQDEVHFMLGTLVTRGWYPKGVIPAVGSVPCKDGISISGFVVLGSGQTVVTSPERFTFKSTIDCIRKFLKHYRPKDGKHIYMILDNAPWHQKAKRLIRDESNDEYADIRSRITFLDIPPYSPDLNPIEQLWRKTRREVTHNRYYRSIKGLWNALSNFFMKFKRPNSEIADLCTFDFDKKKSKSKNIVQVGMEHQMDKDSNGNFYEDYLTGTIWKISETA